MNKMSRITLDVEAKHVAKHDNVEHDNGEVIGREGGVTIEHNWSPTTPKGSGRKDKISKWEVNTKYNN